MTNPLSQVARYIYDSRGQLTSVSVPEDVSASFAYDDLGLLSSVTDPNGNAWTRNYDASGRLLSKTDPLGRTTSYSYDSRQRVSSVEFPEGKLAFTYDEAGNLVRRLYSDGTDIQYCYDNNDRLLTANGISLAYDASGRLINSNGLLITRDDADRIAALSCAPGKTVAYEYNSQGLLVWITDWLGGSTELSYDEARQLASIRRPNGVTTQFSYGGDGRLLGISESGSGVDTSIRLTRDAGGQIISAERNLPRGPLFVPAAQQFTYDEAHQVTDFTYDSLGRLVSDGSRTYTWDLASGRPVAEPIRLSDMTLLGY